MSVVVVESPAKAKTIEKYLGKGFTVLASYGHVRDLPPKDGSVRPDEDFAMDWEVDTRAQKRVREIAEALKGDDRLILATDPDREGEAISWHLLEALRKRRAVKKSTAVERVVFNAITKTAVSDAMKNPRQIDDALVEAYLARRALDYLVGFTLSPVLWRKLPGAKSAGRVQSVCLRLVVEREMEIEAFVPREYWTVKAVMTGAAGDEFEARLFSLDGAKLDRFDLNNEEAAARAVAMIEAREFSVAAVEAKPATRNPSPPFMTSTLQQEASRKLGMGAKATMAAAQRLYEAGWITYMRTDGVDMAPEAVEAARAEIGRAYGKDYLPGKARVYKTKAKNAQEAHECIRPTDFSKRPEDASLEAEQKKLYALIWKRATASQMESARFERTTVDIAAPDGKIGLRATGQVMLFDGFLKLYQEGRDDAAQDEDGARLPALRQGEALTRGAVTPEQHFTQPPPRYTEASLVKRMEELGIGRPSTYASIISVIQDRGYVEKDKNRLIPQDKGRLVTAFLENYFARLVQYDFTADLEERLDDVSGGRAEWKAVLRDFWAGFEKDVDKTRELRVSDVLDRINETLAPHVFPPREDGKDPRQCPLCEAGQLSIKTGKFGAFIGCANYPECRYTRPFGADEGDAPAEAGTPDGKLLGHAPDGDEVRLLSGRFGPYLQKGTAPEGEKPHRASIPKGVEATSVELPYALKLLSLPREIGKHPEDGRMMTAAIGPNGPYVRLGVKGEKPVYANITEFDEVFDIGINRAVALIAEKQANPRRRGQAEPKPPLRELGEHPERGGAVRVLDGRYGPYIKWEKVNATLPKDVTPENVTMERAVELIAEREAKGGKKTTRAKPAAKKTTKKKPAKKAPAAAKD